MTGLYRLQCPRCGFVREGAPRQTVVLKEDGSLAVLPRAMEMRAAEMITGKQWGDLLLQKRIRYRYALVCLACGKLDYYYSLRVAPDDGTPLPDLPPTVREAAGCTCRSCGKGPLYPLYAVTSRLRALLGRLGLSRGGLQCPQCKQGQLVSSGFDVS
jgi:hypothetical protein